MGVQAPASKYGAKRTVVDGHNFPSKREAARYGTLRLMQAAGEVLWFACQPVFMLEGGRWRADFIVAWANGSVTVEDSKGYQTAEYKRIKKMVMARYPRLPLREV